jgi:L-threonylcarbamoyladenylate synthase
MTIISEQSISIPDIVSALKDGKTIVYPTETCYGLGCDALNIDAVQKIFSIKKRQKEKPLLVVASSVSMMMEYVEWNQTLEIVAERYWPGPLTVVTELRPDVELPAGVVGLDRTLAFRVTGHPLAAAISAALGRPIVSTSANISSEASPYDIESVLDMFGGAEHQPDIIIDGGTLTPNSPSTIVRVKNDRVEVIRQGEVIVSI